MHKILIIEDDQIVANIYRNKFSQEGFHAEIASDGDAGMQIIPVFQPDAILLDLMLPKVTGLELMKNIRSQPNLSHVPIIVFSNTYLTNMVQEAWKAGATKCLSKANCSPKQVIEAVRSTLANAGRPTTANNTPGTQAGSREPGAGRVAATHGPDTEFQEDPQKSFINSLPATLNFLRGILSNLAKADSDAARLAQLQDFYRRVHALTGNAGVTGMAEIAQLSDALEALLREISDKPANVNPSTLRTLASAVDTLGVLFGRAGSQVATQLPTAEILVVDDEAISRRAICYALGKAKLRSHSVESAEVAYNSLLNKRYDLVFLDVDMPGMSGYELCAKIRQLPAHRKTPVVFVTSLNGFEARANSLISGGNDFIGKPFLFMELAVKALIYLQRGIPEKN